MKLNEAVILMESYKDLRRIITELHGNVFFNREFSPTSMNVNLGSDHELAVVMKDMYRELQAVVEMIKRAIPDTSGLPENRNDIYSASGLVKTIEYAARHRMTAARNLPERDTGHWIRKARAYSTQENGAVASMFDIINSLTSLLEDILEFEKEPPRQKPEIVTIKKTPSFEVYRLDNYVAARKICNTFNTNFCIGAEPRWFSSYGAERGRDTYAIILPNRTVVIVHYGGGRDYLVTSHDNDSDFTFSRADNKGGGVVAVAKDFINAGVGIEAMYSSLSTIMPEEVVDEIMEDYEDLLDRLTQGDS